MDINKRAQFFLIAALIISGIILSFGNTYTKINIQTEDAKIYDLSEQLKYESTQVLDNGLIAGSTSDVIAENLKNLTEYYANLNPDSNIDIIFGNSTELKSISKKQGEASIEISNILDSKDTKTGTNITKDSSNKKVKVKIPSESNSEGAERSFDMNEGQNFYLIIRKKINDQDVIIYK